MYPLSTEEDLKITCDKLRAQMIILRRDYDAPDRWKYRVNKFIHNICETLTNYKELSPTANAIQTMLANNAFGAEQFWRWW